MAVDRYDVLAFVGLAMLGVGLWMVAPALALIVVGGLVLAVGLFGSAATAARRKGGN